jgi:addiction module RelE/StbE family toxin
MVYAIEWTKKAEKGLEKLDRVKREKVRKAVDELARDPYKKGEPLKRDLKGQWSLHLLGNKYRVVYEIRQAKLVIIIVEAGWREGFYKKLGRKY